MSKALLKTWDRIRYCSLILDGRVSESALLILCRDILIDRGALPVGEVGKQLQEMTGMAGLSAALKEKFGGLKKFLEKYPNVFVIWYATAIDMAYCILLAFTSSIMQCNNVFIVMSVWTTRSTLTPF